MPTKNIIRALVKNYRKRQARLYYRMAKQPKAKYHTYTQMEEHLSSPRGGFVLPRREQLDTLLKFGRVQSLTFPLRMNESKIIEALGYKDLPKGLELFSKYRKATKAPGPGLSGLTSVALAQKRGIRYTTIAKKMKEAHRKRLLEIAEKKK